MPLKTKKTKQLDDDQNSSTWFIFNSTPNHQQRVFHGILKVLKF